MPYYVTYLDPTSSFNLAYAVNAVAMPVIGGMTSWIGPVIGAILLGTIQQVATVTISSAINLLIVGLLLILFVIAAPKGVVDLLQGPTEGPFAPPLGRMQFFIRWLGLFIVTAVILLVNSVALILLFGFIGIAIQLAIASQRLRDMGWSGWLALLLFIPIVDIALLIVLFFAPGQRPGHEVMLASSSPAVREGQARG
jgi:hypothetical protein